MISQIRILVICCIAMFVTQLLALSLATSGNSARAQSILLSEDNRPAGSQAVVLPNTNRQQSLSLTKVAPNARAEPDSPQSPNTGFSYYSILGTAFTPISSGAAYDYDGGGCIHQTVDPVVNFQAPLNLPPGSVIKYVRFYYYDASIYDMNLWLRNYQPGGTKSTLAIASSSGTAGLGYALSQEITETVDMYNYSYALTWGPVSPTSNGQQICGVRVAYYAPQIFGTFLPSIQRNP